MAISTKRRRGTPKPKRLNLYLTPETWRQVEVIAELRGIENGAAARELLEERLVHLMGEPLQREKVAS